MLAIATLLYFARALFSRAAATRGHGVHPDGT
jgi:hypothetical protein